MVSFNDPSIRGDHVDSKAKPKREAIRLPPRPFLYTLDQISVLLELSSQQVHNHCYFEGRSIGTRRKNLLLARNLNIGTNKQPDWRIAERELIRWMRVKGFKYYDGGSITH